MIKTFFTSLALSSMALLWAPMASAHPPQEASIDAGDVPYVCAYLKANNHDTWLVAVMAEHRIGATGDPAGDLHDLIVSIDHSGVCS